MNGPPSRVSVTRCPDYQLETLTDRIEQILSVLEPLPFPRDARVLLKPNCLSAHHGPDQPVNTRTEVVEAVGRYLLRHHQVRLVIADSPGMGSYGKTKRTYAHMDLGGVALRLGAELVNLEELGLIELRSPSGRILPAFRATALLDQVDVLVNLPKLKTHMLTGITGAVKNVLGLLPGSLKREVHVDAPSGPAMALALIDILAGIKEKIPLSLNLMDGIIAMEGAGPSRGRARQTGWLMASTDPVALDVIAAVVMGFDPKKIITIKEAAEAGLGTADISGIELSGAHWNDLPALKFKHPYTKTREWAERIIPPWLIGRAFSWLSEAKPSVRKAQCQKCGLCVQACPAQALTLTEEGLQFNEDLCIECYCCLEHCPHEGLRVPRGLLDRFRS
jgi:uncharacterized protein (DUF362 family)/Pyruvate/2-oxoacid:ferredoxin oxidoreductase delta subunit